MIFDQSHTTKKRRVPFYSSEDLKSIDLHKIPSHIAIIMDGNRRWAQSKGLPIEVGHSKGADQLKKIVEAAMEIQIETLTVFALSTENKNRSEGELKALFSLFEQYLKKECQSMVEKGINFQTIGDLTRLPESLILLIEKVKNETKMGKQLNLVIAFNYGGRDELCRAFQKMIQVHQGAFEPGFLVTPSEIALYLDTAPWGDPQLVIRTSGEYRISNFLLWQISYAEIYFSSVYWPDFCPKAFLKAIQSYQHRQIRRGL